MKIALTTLFAVTVCACGADPIQDPYGTLAPTCTWYFFADLDGDGWGDSDQPLQACEAPNGYVSYSGDCDDSDPNANPEGVEVCDGIDNDCDGLVDIDDPDVDASGAGTFYRDSDGDGFGNPYDSIDGCELPAGYVANDDDCDDTDDAVHPGAAEICDGVDNDCDNSWDDDDDDIDLSSAGTWFLDDDNDGWGAGDPVIACDRPYYHVEQDGDCDDASASVHPTADEVCDGVDNDCDDFVDAAGCDLYAGQYTGTYQLSAVEKVGSIVVNSMSCSGSITIDVDAAVSPALEGTFDCIYSGGLGGFDSTQTGTLAGDLLPDGTITGVIEHEYSWDLSRSYSFDGSIAGGELEATGTGSLLPNPQSAVPWEVDFSFSAN